MKDESKYVREQAADALGKIGDTRATGPLIAALEDKESDVRAKAARALGKIGDKRAVEPLIAALEDERSYVRKQAAEALSKITGEDLGKDLRAWREWREENKGMVTQ